jgi:hypothetical protein
LIKLQNCYFLRNKLLETFIMVQNCYFLRNKSVETLRKLRNCYFLRNKSVETLQYLYFLQYLNKKLWRSGTALGCNAEDPMFEFARLYLDFGYRNFAENF